MQQRVAGCRLNLLDNNNNVAAAGNNTLLVFDWVRQQNRLLIRTKCWNRAIFSLSTFWRSIFSAYCCATLPQLLSSASNTFWPFTQLICFCAANIFMTFIILSGTFMLTINQKFVSCLALLVLLCALKYNCLLLCCEILWKFQQRSSSVGLCAHASILMLCYVCMCVCVCMYPHLCALISRWQPVLCFCCFFFF